MWKALMRRRMPVAVLLAVGNANAALATPAKPADLALTLAPSASGPRGTGAGLAVSYTLTDGQALPSPLALRFDTLEPALIRSTDQVTDLEVRDDSGTLPMGTPRREMSDGRTWQVWSASRPVHGTLRVSYVVPVAKALPPKRGPHRDLQSAGGGVSGGFKSVLLLPPLQGQIQLTLHWDLPEGQQAVSTFSPGDTQTLTDAAHLDDALFLAGPLRALPSPMPVHGFSISALGIGQDDLVRGADWSRKAYEAERKAFKAPSNGAFRFMVRSYAGGPLDSGTANNGSFLLYLPPAEKLSDESIQTLLAHEMVHVFTRELKDDPGGLGDWYTEGIADYFAIRIPGDSGLYSKEAYLHAVNALAAAYYTNRYRGVSLNEAAAIKWSKDGAWTIPYKRGAMYFANLDAALKIHGIAMSSLDLVNLMNQRIDAGAPASSDTWQALLKDKVGAWAVDDWKAMRDGKLITPDAGAFQACIKAVPISTGYFDLGYVSAAGTSGTLIESVEAGSNAEAAGLKPGDRITEAFSLLPYTESFDTRIHVTVTRGDGNHDITFSPRTKAHEAAFRFSDSGSTGCH